MKKLRRRMLSLLLALAMVVPGGIVSSENIQAKAAKTVKLEKASVTLAIGGTSTIKVKNAGKKAKITYKSMKPSIAKVTNKGKVTAVKPGSTKVKVTVKQSGKKTKTLNYCVKVSKPTLQENTKLFVVDKITLKINYLPKKAKVRWSSGNMKVATVKNGVVTGKSTGSSKITATVTYKKKTYSASTNVIVTKITDEKNAKVGDIVTFGRYEQDNNTSNGKEPIEWQVLAKEDNKILVISKYALDGKRYNETDTSVTWETCTLRKWLDSDFKNAAFNATEKSQIPRVTVTADVNPHWRPSTPPGKNTQGAAPSTTSTS